MSLWDQLGGLAAGALENSLGQGGQSADATAPHPAMLNALLGVLQNQGTAAAPAPGGQPGLAAGVPGLLQTLEQNGLGHLASSWIGGGQNLPISAEQVEQLLGQEQIGQLAQQAGVPQGQASSLIASLLPSLVDHLTPSGTLEHTLLDEGINLLRSRLG
jgi:uncharacterized protein YidB (DUF937 family)